MELFFLEPKTPSEAEFYFEVMTFFPLNHFLSEISGSYLGFKGLLME